MKAERVLGIGITPSAIGQLFEDFKGHVVARLVTFCSKKTRSFLRFDRADICCLEDCAKCPSRRDRIPLDELTARIEHAAEVLRPRAVVRGAQDDTADLLGS